MRPDNKWYNRQVSDTEILCTIYLQNCVNIHYTVVGCLSDYLEPSIHDTTFLVR